MFAERISPKEPLPGGEEKLRTLLEGIRARTPDYEDMDPRFARLIETHLSRLHAASVRLGPVQSLTFLEPLSPGWDIYEVHREHGTVRWRIALGADGKIFCALPVDLSFQTP